MTMSAVGQAQPASSKFTDLRPGAPTHRPKGRCLFLSGLLTHAGVPEFHVRPQVLFGARSTVDRLISKRTIRSAIWSARPLASEWIELWEAHLLERVVSRRTNKYLTIFATLRCLS